MGFLGQKTVLMCRTILLSFSVLFVCFSCSGPVSELPYYNTPDFSPYFLTPKEAARQITHRIPSFEFLNQHDKLYSSENLNNKIHVANFIFTVCTDICPQMTSNMKIVEKAFLNDSLVKILSFSVTPWIDTSKKLFDYAAFYNIPKLFCFSGGTEATKLYQTVKDTLEEQGFIFKIEIMFSSSVLEGMVSK